MNNCEVLESSLSPPWTPSLEQVQFNAINSLHFGSVEDVVSHFGLSDAFQHVKHQSLHRIHAERPSSQGHRRYLSFPLSTLETKSLPPFSSSTAALSPVVTNGLGITLSDQDLFSPSNDNPPENIATESPVSPTMDIIMDHENLDSFNDGDDSSNENEDIEPCQEDQPTTAAGRLAKKRKMRRFRLTHQQTRYLMSEFARQAHPDAAQREKLARNIPGLSSRQVQVWFQNRRAKLKRVTHDDRAYIVQSRALPENFDMTQALRSPFGHSQLDSAVMSSPSTMQGHARKDSAINSPTPITIQRSSASMDPPRSVPLSSTSMCSPGMTVPDLPASYQSINLCSSFAPQSPVMGRNMTRAGTPGAASPVATTPQTSRIIRAGTPFYDSPCPNMVLSTFGTSNDIHANDRPYGLGFSFASIPGFQHASFSSIRDLSNQPTRVLVPQATIGQVSHNPCLSACTSSPLSPAMAFAPLNMTTGVAPFLHYNQ